MDKIVIVAFGYIALFVIIILIALFLIKKKRINDYKKEIEHLDKKKNEIESAPVVSELAKLETIVKNDKFEEKYKKWFSMFEDIKNNNIPKINDMIIDLDAYLDRKEYN